MASSIIDEAIIYDTIVYYTITVAILAQGYTPLCDPGVAEGRRLGRVLGNPADIWFEPCLLRLVSIVGLPALRVDPALYILRNPPGHELGWSRIRMAMQVVSLQQPPQCKSVCGMPGLWHSQLGKGNEGKRGLSALHGKGGSSAPRESGTFSGQGK
eukprot:7669885-Heterocapsa_arctica.AAC.1